jgi:hypothetical protein
MATRRLGLAFIIGGDPGAELPGPPICRVWVKSPLAGGAQYPEPFKDGVFLTPESHPDQLEVQIQSLYEELDEIVNEARLRYAAWEQTRSGGKP